MSEMNIWQGSATFSMGDVVYPPRGRLGPRLQPHLQLVYVWDGHARIWINGTRVDVGSGECILLLPHRRERFVFSDETRTRHGWCEVRTPSLEPAFERQIEEIEGHVFETPKTVEALARAGLQLKEDPRWGAQRAFDDVCSATLHAFAADAGLSGIDAAAQPHQRLAPALTRAIELIHSRPAEIGSIGEIAEAARVSQQHLARLFRSHLSTTPNAYLWRVRTERAVDLIRSTGLSLVEIARQSGFKTQFHLSRRVREQTGAPPTELR